MLSAVQGCTHVIHVASPFPDRKPSNPEDLIKPAVDGTLAVLKAASAAGTVKRVVLTSSIAAVHDTSIALPKDKEESKTFDEESWTNTEDSNLDTYALSKTLAEKAAWDYIKDLPEDKKIDLAVINPGVVIGPLLTKRYTTSHNAIKKLLDKSTPAVAKIQFNITDVRDVATAHVKALTLPEAVGKRHLIVNTAAWLKEIALVLQKEFRPQGYFIPVLTAPNALVRVSSIYDKSMKIVVPRLGKEVKYDNTRMTQVLKISPTDFEKTVIDTANSMIEHGIIKKSKKVTKKERESNTTTTTTTNDIPTDGTVDSTNKQNGDAVDSTGDGEKKPDELEPEDKEKKLDVQAPAPALEVTAN